MSKLKEGTQVTFVDENHNLKIGVIDRVHESLDIAIVKIENEDFKKVHFSRLAIVENQETKEEPKPTEPVEKQEITITPQEFKKIGVDVAVELAKKHDPMIGFACTLIVARLHKVLFFDEGEE